MQKTLYIPIDTNFDFTVECPKLVKRGDTLNLQIKVFTNGVLANLTGQTINLILRKPDSTVIEKTITNISNGVITAVLDVQATVVAGAVTGEVEIYDTNGQTTTNTFIYIVTPAIADNVVEISANDIQTLVQIRNLITDGNIAIAIYEQSILAIGNTVAAVEALENIKSYIDTNLIALQNANASAVINIANEVISNSELEATLVEANQFVIDNPNIGNLVENVGKHTTQLLDIHIDVKSLGVQGDGVTDDTLLIQNTINSAPNGSSVYFPIGTYLVSNIILKDKVSLIGADKHKTIIKLANNSNKCLIEGTSTNSLSIKNLTLDGDKANQTNPTGLENIKLLTCSDVDIIDCIIKDAYFSHGVYLNGCSKMDVNNNEIISNGGSAVLLSGCTELKIRENLMDLNGQFGISDDVNESTDISIYKNTIKNSMNSGIEISKSIGTSIDKNIVSANHEHGIWIAANKCDINGNKVIGNGNAIDTQGVVIQANYCSVVDNLVEGNFGVGIDMGNCIGSIVESNRVVNNGLIGIELNSTEKTVVNGNEVEFNNNINYAQTDLGGIHLHQSNSVYGWSGYSNENIISNNKVGGGTYQNYGIYISSDSDYISITGNNAKLSGITNDIEIKTSKYSSSSNITKFTTDKTVTIPSTWDLIISKELKFVTLVGNTTINTINSASNSTVGSELIIKFTEVLSIQSYSGTNTTGNILLATTNKVTTVGEIVKFIYDGTYWRII